MSALRLLPQTSTVEEKLLKMRELDRQIKELSAFYDMLKDEVVIEHFSSNVEYRTSYGLVLATRIEVNGQRFSGKEFENDYPDLHAEYKRPFTEFRFSLKK